VKRSGRLPSCRNQPGTRLSKSRLLSGLNASSTPRTVFTQESRPRASARMGGNSLASAAFVRTILRSLGRRDARCVGPTSAFSRSSYEHSCLAGSLRCRSTCARRTIGGYRLFHGRANRFGGSLVLRMGVLVPSARRSGRTSDISVATPVMRSRSREPHTNESRQDRAQPARVNDASRDTIRDAFRRSRAVAPQHPLECPASVFHKLTALPP
jgi:hypothetical protein